MAGLKPFFLTGANAKIKVNGKTLAYCTGLTYSVQVKHATPIVLGMYEPTSIEPLSIIVTGSFSVIRYIADVKGHVGGPGSASISGNGIGTWGPEGLDERFKGGLKLDGADGRTYDNLNPAKLDKATGFDIHIYQKIDSSANDGVQSVAKVKDARITQANFEISKKSPAIQTFNFTAIYVDEDSFLSDFSGLGQQFQ